MRGQRPRLKGALLAATAGISLAALLGACAAPLPPGLLPPNDVVPPGQGKPPVLSKYLVPYTSMVQADPMWSKQAPPTVHITPPKGCDMATTDYAQLTVPEVYEVLIGCPTSGDIKVLYSQVRWGTLTTAGWEQSAGYGSYGEASRAFVQAYTEPGLGTCWTYLDFFRYQDIFGVSGYCDQTSNTPLPAIKAAARQWTGAVLHQIQHADNAGKKIVI